MPEFLVSSRLILLKVNKTSRTKTNLEKDNLKVKIQFHHMSQTIITLAGTPSEKLERKYSELSNFHKI